MKRCRRSAGAKFDDAVTVRADSDKLVGQPANFVGIDNFVKILDSSIFTRAAFNTILFTALATVSRERGYCSKLSVSMKW